MYLLLLLFSQIIITFSRNTCIYRKQNTRLRMYVRVYYFVDKVRWLVHPNLFGLLQSNPHPKRCIYTPMFNSILKTSSFLSAPLSDFVLSIQMTQVGFLGVVLLIDWTRKSRMVTYLENAVLEEQYLVLVLIVCP